MNRFSKLFLQKNRRAFIPFFTLGDPDFDSSLYLIKEAIKSGADAIELGVAFSDPIADGHTNQRSMQRAIKSGVDFNRCIELLQQIRNEHPNTPIGLLIYYNILFKQGQSAYEKLAQVGVDAIVSADLPHEESSDHIKLLNNYSIGHVPMIAPNTIDYRAKVLAKNSSAFNYVISGFGTTGAKKDISSITVDRIKHIRNIIDEPMVVGFGISSPDHVKKIWHAGANGVIVGSYFSTIIEDNLNNISKAAKNINSFIKGLN